ncbi:MAG: MucR family transcriptional regulator [Pseudomonadota bacterium]|jgi:predicted transcriptional regulator|tara:strand:+ start:28334 stop:28759 length:426 start_codon:yes stop_codon:yes gene_type:complete
MVPGKALMLKFTVEMTCIYLKHQPVAVDEISDLIVMIAQSISDEPAVVTPSRAATNGAVSIEQSLASPSYILSMINGKPYKMLKSHIIRQGMTPLEYCRMFGLPADYPMVAADYSAQRRVMIKDSGLGTTGLRWAKSREKG